MQLYHSPTSPYVRKVMVLLHETGKTGDVELIDAATAPTAPNAALLPVNPLGKVPCLARANGPALSDSRVICRYLDARYGAGLCGSGEGAWATATLESLGDGICDAALLVVFEARLRADGERSEAWVAAQKGKVERALDHVEARWLAHLAGPLDMGQIALGCAIAYLDFRGQVGEWRGARPGLASWFEGFAARPSMVETAPPAG